MSNNINRIKNDPILSHFICDNCSENDISVTFDQRINKEEYVIIKVDDYYNSLNRERPPPSPDCLIVLKCNDIEYSLSIVELKAIKNSQGFTFDNMIGKFETCVYDFIEHKFSELLFIDYKRIKLFFVSDIEIYRRDIGLKMELLMNTRIRYGNKSLMITPYKPTPTIKRCY